MSPCPFWPWRWRQLRPSAWESLRRFDKPFLCAFSDGDPVTAGGERRFLREVPGTAGQAHTTIEGGGHFIQEDRGPELAAQVIDLVRSTPDAASQPALVAD